MRCLFHERTPYFIRPRRRFLMTARPGMGL
jgi:hypothetical protein